MNEIEVLSPGLFTTVQDLGREGYGPIGVSASGAADSVSLRIGNRLADNPEDAAALEMTLVGGRFRFLDSGTIALTGSDFGASIDGKNVDPYRAYQILRGQVLQLGPTRSGARCYLCVRGGIAAKRFLGSASTHVLSGLGGYEGRPLRTGDRLKIGSASTTFEKRSILPGVLQRLAPRKILHVTPGPQIDHFPESMREAFFSSAYRVTEQSDRMGLRLEGPPLTTAGNIITEGVPLGAIQVPEGGLPMILFVDQQTTGGYPKIANVIAADMHSVGQLRPREEVHFEMVGWDTAIELFKEQENILASERLISE